MRPCGEFSSKVPSPCVASPFSFPLVELQHRHGPRVWVLKAIKDLLSPNLPRGSGFRVQHRFVAIPKAIAYVIVFSVRLEEIFQFPWMDVVPRQQREGGNHLRTVGADEQKWTLPGALGVHGHPAQSASLPEAVVH